jgi:hypothetical protein
MTNRAGAIVNGSEASVNSPYSFDLTRMAAGGGGVCFLGHKIFNLTAFAGQYAPNYKHTLGGLSGCDIELRTFDE